jgi:hypothetical protein
MRLCLRSVLLVPVFLLLLSVTGCTRYYPVHGTVTYPDGTPVTEGLVVFESQDGGKAVTARGDIQPDGSYRLSIAKPGDGVPPGKYRALVAPKTDLNDVDRPHAPAIDPAFADFKTSGLEFEVTPDATEFPIHVTKPGKRRQ